MDASTIFFGLFGLYALVMSVFIVSENRRPQTTLAWLLAFLALPIIGVLVYFFFGRGQKAFSKERELVMQNLEPNVRPLLTPLLGRQDAEITRLEQKSLAHRKLMMLVRQNSRSALTRRNRVEILQNADTFYPHMMEDMEAARHSIHLQYYVWRSDAFSEKLKEIMCAKAEAGIEVRLLYDPVGSSISRAYLRALKASGVHVAPVSPLWHLHTVSYRNHRKITVVDGTVGYTGGMNIGQQHLDGGEGFDAWRDTQLRIEGEAAALLQAVFMVDWANGTGEDLFAPGYFPIGEPTAALEPNEASEHDAVADDSTTTTSAPTASDSPAGGDVPVQILTSGPDSRWAAIRQLYALMAVSAERHVMLQSPYFIPDASLTEALRSAALSGVDVQVMISARPSGNRLPAWASNTYMADIVEAGVRVFLYYGGYLHAKTISIDSKICSVGTVNIDVRSFSLNYEMAAVLYDERLAGDLEAAFERDLAECTEFDVEAYRNRGISSQFRDSAARLFSPLL